MWAAWSASLESVQLLLAAGAGVNACNERGEQALLFAVFAVRRMRTDALRVVEALLAAGADVAARNDLGNTALHLLATRSHGQPLEAVVARLLLGAGADGRAVNIDGETPAQRVPVAAHGGELYGLLVEAAGA